MSKLKLAKLKLPFQKVTSTNSLPPKVVKERPHKVKRYNISDPYFWIKTGGFCLFLAFLIATVVYFEGTFATTFYAPKSLVGVGLLIGAISWMLWFAALGRQNRHAYFINYALAVATFAISFGFSLGIATAVTGGLIFVLIVACFVFRLVKPAVLPKPLFIKVGA